VWLIVGLGNPGTKYLLTRHNVGFIALDYLAKSVGVRNDDAKNEHKAQTVSFNWETTPIKLVKPQTFMNLSGESVAPLANFYKVQPSNIIVVHDEVDLPFGRIQIKTNGSAGGHNGLKSLIEKLGTQEFTRVRVGIGRSPIAQVDTADWVLQKFSESEQEPLSEILNRVADAIESIVFDGVTKAMNTYNKAPADF
jgi:peptidyl-tRNA hydrolase, PTH1 family